MNSHEENDRLRATYKDVYEIAKILENEALESFDGEKARYKEGYTDGIIARMYGRPYIKSTHVMKIRNSIFGSVNHRPASKHQSIEDQIADMQAKLKVLMRQVSNQ